MRKWAPFGWGDIETPIHPITGRHSLFPRSFTRRPMGVPRGSLAHYGRDYGLTLFLPSNTSGLDLAYSPMALCQRIPSNRAEYPATHLLVQA